MTPPNDRQNGRRFTWRLGLAGVALVAVGALIAFAAVSAFSGTSKTKSALKEARLACGLYLPKTDGQAVTDKTSAQAALKLVTDASTHAAKAASLDSRWNELNSAESAMLDAWQYEANVIWAGQLDTSGMPLITDEESQTYGPLYSAYLSGARSARAECAKAAAG